jgi:hypothetical protein
MESNLKGKCLSHTIVPIKVAALALVPNAFESSGIYVSVASPSNNLALETASVTGGEASL